MAYDEKNTSSYTWSLLTFSNVGRTVLKLRHNLCSAQRNKRNDLLLYARCKKRNNEDVKIDKLRTERKKVFRKMFQFFLVAYKFIF